MVLAFSRLMVVRVVFDQKVETWLRCHAEPGGVPKVVVPDNLKAAVIRASFGADGPTVLNRSYREFARFFDFQVDPAPVRAPKKKGKVESAVKYVKNNFFAARPDMSDVVEVRGALQRWITETANAHTHGTTHKRPAERFEVEREHLLDLPATRWEPALWREAKVHTDTHVQVERAMYSVPWRLVGKRVLVRLTPRSVEVTTRGPGQATLCPQRRGALAAAPGDDRCTQLTN